MKKNFLIPLMALVCSVMAWGVGSFPFYRAQGLDLIEY